MDYNSSEAVKIAIAQIASTGDKNENLKKALKFIDTIPEKVDMIVFPEYLMGYPESGLTRKYVETMAEKPDGEFIGEIKKASVNKGIWAVINFYERDSEKIYNASIVLDSEGEVAARYRKTHLFDILGYRESEVFNRGDKAATFHYKGLKFGLAICHDIRFPEHFRRMALEGAEVFLISSAWFAGPLKEHQWHILGQARAMENVAYLVNVCNAANPFVGMSYVADPYGLIRFSLGAGEKIGFFTINPEEIRQARRAMPLIQAAKMNLKERFHL